VQGVSRFKNFSLE